MNAIRTAVGYLRHGRYREFFEGLRSRVPAVLFRNSHGVVFELCYPFSVPPSPGMPETSADPDLVELHADSRACCVAVSSLSEAEIQRRFAAGDRCLGVRMDGEFVNVNWLHFGKCYVRGMGLRLDLSPNDCYLYGVVTKPEHRGRGIYRASQVQLIDRLKAQGAKRILQLVERGNAVPLKVLPTLGYRPCCSVRHITILGFQRTLVKDSEGRTVGRQFRVWAPRDVFRI